MRRWRRRSNVSSRYEVDNDLQDFHETREQDREISLGTTTILGIFLVLALLCAVFFGFGYSLGRRSAHPAPIADETSTTDSESTTSKPAPGSLVNHAAPISSKPTADTGQSSASPSDTPDAMADQSRQAPAPTPVKATVTNSQPDLRAESVAKSAPKPAVIVPVAAAAPSVGIALVQIAAVSHQEDADVLVTALKRRGYNVTVRHEPQDKLLHVQIGPFATKKEADAMRQRLQADGYNAIVK
jgi:DedD protein